MSWGLLVWMAAIGLAAWLFPPPSEPPDNPTSRSLR